MVSVSFSELFKLIGQLLNTLFQHVFFLLDHCELSLEVLYLVLPVVDRQLKLRALLPLKSKVLSEHFDDRLEFINDSNFFFHFFDVFVFILKLYFDFRELFHAFLQPLNELRVVVTLSRDLLELAAILLLELKFLFKLHYFNFVVSLPCFILLLQNLDLLFLHFYFIMHLLLPFFPEVFSFLVGKF